MRAGLALVATAALVAGCATAPPPPDAVTPWEQRRSALQGVEAWRVQGRIAVRTEEDGWSGKLTWEQVRDALDVRFRGPLGVGGFRLRGDDESLDLTTSEGDTFTLVDPAAELEARLGWQVPVNSMRYWMLGVPDPAAPASEILDTTGRLAALEQFGWRVDFQSYRQFGDDWMPRKLNIAGGGVRIRMAVERWQRVSTAESFSTY